MDTTRWMLMLAIGCMLPLDYAAAEDTESAEAIAEEELEDSGDLGAAGSDDKAIGVRAQLDKGVYEGSRWFLSRPSVFIGRSSTKATGCNVTSWLVLSGGGKTWTSPKEVENCNDALRRSETVPYLGAFTQTTATSAVAKACIDLYFNGSSHSGMQFCNSSN